MIHTAGTEDLGAGDTLPSPRETAASNVENPVSSGESAAEIEEHSARLLCCGFSLAALSFSLPFPSRDGIP